MTNPICEECDIEMSPFSFEGTQGYSCIGCGWSFDITEGEEATNPTAEAVSTDDLKSLVKSFFVDYLDYIEVHGEDDHIVRPIQVHCGRVLKVKPLGELLSRMREKAGLPPAKTKEELKKELGLE